MEYKLLGVGIPVESTSSWQKVLGKKRVEFINLELINLRWNWNDQMELSRIGIEKMELTPYLIYIYIMRPTSGGHRV